MAEDRYQAAHYAITRLLVASATLREAAPLLLKVLCESLNWDMAELWIVDRTAGVIRLSDAWHGPTFDAATFIEASRQMTFGRGDSLPGSIWQSGEPAWVHDLQSSEFFARTQLARTTGLQSALAIPIHVKTAAPSPIQWQHDVLGLILCFSLVLREPDADVLEALSVIGHQLGEFIEREQRYAFAVGQQRLLEMIAMNAPLTEILTALTRLIESQAEGMLCSILLLDEDGVHVRHGAAPSLPAPYVAAIDGASIGPRAGSCGTAMYFGRPVIVTDILDDPLWADYREIAAPHGLRACWSTPIISPPPSPRLSAASEGASSPKVLGSFAMYYRDVRSPSPREARLIDIATHIAGIAIERTRSEAALARSREQLGHAGRLEALGQLAGSVAHDFNNLLTVVAGNAEILGETLPTPGQRARSALEDIQAAAARGASLTRQLLAFSRRQVLEPERLHLDAVVAGTEKLLRMMIGEHIELLTSSEPSLHPIKADAGQMELAIVNLAVNARDAMPRGGTLAIQTRNVDLDEAFTLSHPEMRPGPYVALSVRDTGHGMTAEVAAHVFDPFFTTKAKGRGAGLGLATVYGIVKQSGGTIIVESKVDRGSTFTIYLPAYLQPAGDSEDDSASGGRSVSSAVGVAAAAQTVLLVEDEESVRRMTRLALVRGGYRVLEAANGVEALEVLRGRSEEAPLLVTDVVMPSMGGVELAARLRALYPDLRVLYMSGYIDDALVDAEVRESRGHYLQKPFTPSALLRKIREILAS